MRSARTFACLCCTLLLTLPACRAAEDAEMDAGSADAAALPEAPEIAALRAVAERYTDVNAALADGYIPDPSGMCVTAEMTGQPAANGAMGIHYLRPDLLQITGQAPKVAGMSTHTDWNQPGILIYEPQADGSLQLVGLEQLVFAAGWTAAGNTAPPTFAGTEYVHMLDDPSTPMDEAHGFEEHYELHAWIPRENPNGMFAEFNPMVTCEHAMHMPTPGN